MKIANGAGLGATAITSAFPQRNFLGIGVEKEIMPFKLWITQDENINDFAIHLDIDTARKFMKYLQFLYEDEEEGNGIEIEEMILKEMKNILGKEVTPYKEKIKPDMYSHNFIVHEDELILSYLNSFAYTIKLWIESKQEIRISQTIDKFACIITAYLYGLKKREVR